jgi:hypothetical protein
MNSSALGCRALSVIFTAALLVGCGGSEPPIGAPGAMPQSRAGATSPAHSGSWMLPEASGQDILYISSNDRGNVYAYTYPQGQLVGTLTGFGYPFGECTDAAGDVFIITDSSLTKAYPSTIYEYAHGGTTPIATLSDPNRALGCAVDPTTGNLAASGGGIAIYKHASGKPKLYRFSVGLWYCGFDDKGNLYTSTINEHYADRARLLRLSAGGSRLEPISMDASVYWQPALGPSVQWRGKYLTVSSIPYRKPMTIYRLRISGSRATVVGSTTLSDETGNVYHGQTWIQGDTVIGVGAWKRSYENALFWPYPRGGEPEQAIKKVGDLKLDLWGVVVSVAQPR